ncbi:OLC1v1006645C1 [Oldenlandia corymbosa var. corymbosa]|uniref:OLC1v1006645C1 n=1 Tax=Oldenlandia corymbosa var. corymbosa TaxID=529605 RepID=A0AAV1DK44_OLDCO|nr:OLC1v1006645C1 [Oldenlandia corymbosa var. corymbosa]
MAFYHHILLFLIIFSFTADSQELWSESCNANIPVKKNTPLDSNINTLITQLVSGTTKNGYIATSYGASNNQVYGLAQCRADVTGTNCSRCIRDAADKIRQLCPDGSIAGVLYDDCLLRYDTSKFAGRLDTSDGSYVYNVENVTDPDSFNKKLKILTGQISSEAVKPGNRGFGRGKIGLTKSENIYGLVQCTMDLSLASCKRCLDTAVGDLTNFCPDKKGCQVLYNSCILRYELYSFF